VSPAVTLLARKYRVRRIGRTSVAIRDLIVPFNDLLKEAGCLYGPLRSEAEQEFKNLETRGLLKLECASRDPNTILKVRLMPAAETTFFDHIGETAPNAERTNLTAIFENAAKSDVPTMFREPWQEFCRKCADSANTGASLAPCFDRTNVAQVAQILAALPRLLSWNGESFRRFASAALFGDSKVLEILQPRIEACLRGIGVEHLKNLADLGIRENPRGVIVHGPLILELPAGSLEVGHLRASVRIGVADLQLSRLTTTATRCVTIENSAMLHELAKLQSGVILASSGVDGGFAHAPIYNFLRSLPPEVDLYHFGDSDPAGFDILRHLRERTGRSMVSLHMTYRESRVSAPLSLDDSKTVERLLRSAYLTDLEKVELRKMKESGSKGAFEQESLGMPQASWPFYSA